MTSAARRRLAFALFIFVWFAFAATASGRLKSIDIQTEFRVAASLVYNGNLQSDHSKDTAVGIDGKDYTNHLLGESLVIAPAVLVDSGVLTARTIFVIAMINALLAAATVVLLMLLLLDLGFSVRVAVATSLVLGFGTIWLAYAHDAFDVTPNGFFLLLSLWAARRRVVGGGAGWLWVSGLGLGMALLMRYSSGLAILPVMAYLAWQRRSQGLARLARELAAWALPVGLATGLLAWANLVRFGSPMNIGNIRPTETYVQPIANQLLSLAGLVASPTKGLLVFAPVLVLAVFGARRLLRRDAPFTWLLVFTVLLTFVFYARLTMWNGDEAWGPRYLVPVVPLAAVLIAPVLAGWRGMGRAGRAAVATLVGLGAAVNFSVVLTGYERAILPLKPILPTDAVSDPGFYFVVGHSQVLEQFRSVWVMVFGPNPFGPYALLNGSQDLVYLYTPDFWWADPWTTPPLRPFLVVVVVLLLLLVALSGYRLLLAVRALSRGVPDEDPGGRPVIKSEQVSQIL